MESKSFASEVTGVKDMEFNVCTTTRNIVEQRSSTINSFLNAENKAFMQFVTIALTILQAEVSTAGLIFFISFLELDVL